MTEPAIADRIEALLVAELGTEANVRVSGLSKVTTGKSRENWLFDASWTIDGSAVSEELIIRCDPEGGLLETDRSLEFAVLQSLETTAVPAPQVRWLDADGSRLGRPALVMVRESGQCEYFALGDDKRSAADRRDLARRLCDLLAEVHRVDWQTVGLDRVLDDPGPEAALAAVDHWERVLRQDQLETYPELELAARWLRSTAPRSPRTVLVHNDFKVGNVLLDPDDGIVALLDWEIAHLGDPHEDLGWVTQPLRTREHFVPGHWEREDLLGHYEAATGWPVDRDAVAWWNAMSCYKTAVMQASGLRSFVEGRSDDLYLPSAAVLGTIMDLVGA